MAQFRLFYCVMDEEDEMLGKLNITTILVAAIAAVAGVVGAPFVSELLKRSFAEEDKKIQDEQDMISYLQQRLDKYIVAREVDVEKRAKELEQINSLRIKIVRLEDEVAQLKATKVHRDAKELIAIMMNSKPWPSWIQDMENRLWYLNDAYCKKFGIIRKDFWTPVNILAQYPAKTVSVYIANDMKVLESNTTMHFRERVPQKILFPEGPNNPAKYYNVVKYPTPVNGSKYMMGDLFEDGKESILDYIK